MTGDSAEPNANVTSHAVRAPARGEARGTLRSVGKWGLDWLRYVRDLFRFFRRAVVVLLFAGTRSGSVVSTNTLAQIKYTGIDALPVVTVLAALLGTAIVVQALSYLSGGGGAVVGSLMDLLVIRELAPLMTAVIIIGRSGSAITVDLANMAVDGEIDLLQKMGIDPMHYLVVPRMIAVTYASLCLCVWFDLVCILGGYSLAALAIDTPGSVFLATLASSVSPVGVAIGLTKSAVFGLLIATISTWQGLNVRGRVTMVPVATQRSVVHCLVAAVLLDVVMTVLSTWQLTAGGL